MTIESLKKIAAEIGKVSGVTSARVWTKAAGKERIYIDTVKKNGGKNWGLGMGTITVHADGRIEAPTEWAGAATATWHETNKTVEQIETIVKNNA